jgi:hypothetical protein
MTEQSTTTDDGEVHDLYDTTGESFDVLVVTADQVGGTLDGMPSGLPPKVTTKDPAERRQIARMALTIARSVLAEYMAERAKKQSPFTKGGRLGFGRTATDEEIERFLKQRERIGWHLRLVREALGFTITGAARAMNELGNREKLTKLERGRGQWSEPLVRRMSAFYEKEIKKLERVK